MILNNTREKRVALSAKILRVLSHKPFLIYFLFSLIAVLLQQQFLSTFYTVCPLVDLPLAFMCFTALTCNTRKSLMVMLWLSFLMETHNSVPMGFYFCIYWNVTAILSLIKGELSWVHVTSWGVIFFFAQLWSLLFTVGVQLFVGYEIPYSLLSFGEFFLALFSAVGLGLLVGMYQKKLSLES